MIRRPFVWSLALLLVSGLEARDRTVEEQARKIPSGSEVIVILTNKQTLNGRMGAITGDRFQLQSFVAGKPDREVLFQDVGKLRQVKEPSRMHKIGSEVLFIVLLPFYLLNCAFEPCFGF